MTDDDEDNNDINDDKTTDLKCNKNVINNNINNNSSSTADGLTTMETTKKKEDSSSFVIRQNKKKRKHHKPRLPPGFPKRPLSDYNIFFMETRKKLLSSDEEDMTRIDGHNTTTTDKQDAVSDDEHPTGEDSSKNSYNNNNNHQSRSRYGMVKRIAAMWKEADNETRERYDRLAKEDFQRHQEELQAYRREEESKNQRRLDELEEQETERRRKEEEEERQELRQWKKEREAQEFATNETRRRMQEAGGETRRLFSSFDSFLRGTKHDSTDDMHVLLQNEARALELAERFRVQQLSLAERLRVSNPQLQIFAALENERVAFGLPSVAISYDMAPLLLDNTRTPLAFGSLLGWDAGYLRPQQGYYYTAIMDQQKIPPGAATRLHLGTLRADQEEATMPRHHLNHIPREAELIYNQLGYSVDSSPIAHQDATFSQVAAKRQKLPEEERLMADLRDQREDHTSSSFYHCSDGGMISGDAAIPHFASSSSTSQQLEVNRTSLQQQEEIMLLKAMRERQEMAEHPTTTLPPPGGY